MESGSRDSGISEAEQQEHEEHQDYDEQMLDGKQYLSRASNSPEEDPRVLLTRVQQSGALIEKLTHIVKAQHGKIEELRERLHFSQTGTVGRASINFNESWELKTTNEELQRTVNKVKFENGRLKNEVETLRKANRRFRSMLKQEADTLALGIEGDTSVRLSPIITTKEAVASKSNHSPDLMMLSSQNTSLSQVVSSRPSQRERAASAIPWASSESLRGPSIGRGPPLLPPNPKATRLVGSLPLFWRDIESPAVALGALVEIAERLVSDIPSSVLTLYMVDPWLRSAFHANTISGAGGTASDESRPIKSPGSRSLAVFYLGLGKTELEVFPALRSTLRPEPPCFSELQALPHRTRTTMAVALSMPGTQRRLAVLQATCSGAEDGRAGNPADDDARPLPTPRVLRNYNRAVSPENSGFSDTHMAYLQLVCGIAANNFCFLERLAQRAKLMEHMNACMDVAVEVNKSKTILDFEQRVRQSLSSIFNASSVRVLFFDPDTQKLLIMSSMRTKTLTSLGLDRGAVGYCASKRTVLHIPNIALSPHIDVVADGLQRSSQSGGKSGPPLANSMLCGPLLVGGDEAREGDVTLFGVVQVMEARKRPPPGGVVAPDSEMSEEEYKVFERLLRVFAYAGYRALKAHELSAHWSGQPAHLSRLLMG